MWKYDYHLLTNSGRSAIWDLYENVVDWPTWDDSITQAKLNGFFENEAKGSLSFANNTSLAFVLSDVSTNRSFTSVSTLTKENVEISFFHLLEEVGETTKITHGVTITGSNADLLGNKIGLSLTKDIPATMTNLINASGGILL